MSRIRSLYNLLLQQKTIVLGVLFLIVITAIIVLFSSSTSRATDERIVVFYDNGVEKVIVTYSENVEDALRDAGISIGEHDFIDTEIDMELIDSMTFVNIRRARMVTVIDPDSEREERVVTAKGSNSEIARAAGIRLHPEDIVERTINQDFLNQNGAFLEMRITRAKVVNLILYGQNLTMRTQASTVEEFLKEKNIELNEDDTISERLDAPIVGQMELIIWRNGLQTISVEEEIPYEIEEVEDDEKFIGFREIKNPGEVGSKTVIYEVDMLNGEELSRTRIREIIVREPVAQVEVVGTKRRTMPWSGPIERERWMREAGIPEVDWGYVGFIVQRESNWNPLAVNPSSGAYGLCQALPGNRMYEAGTDWRTNPVTQLRWCHQYAMGRYFAGSPMICNSHPLVRCVSCDGLRRGWQCAFEFWQRNHWW